MGIFRDIFIVTIPFICLCSSIKLILKLFNNEGINLFSFPDLTKQIKKIKEKIKITWKHLIYENDGKD